MGQLYGIIGFPLGHTFSPSYFNRKFADMGIDARYEAFPLASIAELPTLLARHPQICGLNVTIPYKSAVLPYLDDIHPDAVRVGAVNCIGIRKGRLTGYNTDVIGFRDSLMPLLHPRHNRALVLGTGGSSRAVVHVLEGLGIACTRVSRHPVLGQSVGYQELSEFDISRNKLIVNTTPLGMAPHTDTLPQLPYDALGSLHLLYDLVYNPAETPFLQAGRRHGAAVKNGLEMLHLQAEAGWKIWTGE
jgi:shikimate dehydrogenase